MTKMLASVQNREEAEIVFQNGADIIDMKNPANGALGAVDLAKTLEVKDFISGRRPISAACGDLPMHPEMILQKVEEFAAAGLDYIKIGLFPSAQLEACVNALQPLASHNKLIAVVFADNWNNYDEDLFEKLAICRFHGLMIDTADKSRGRLLNHLSPDQIGKFIKNGQSKGLMIGVAGSLEAPDISRLLTYDPDFMGFRGALCVDLDRRASIDATATAKIRGLIPEVLEEGIPASVDYKLLAARGYFPEPEEAGLGADKIFVRDFVLPVHIGAYSFEHGKTQKVRFDVTAEVLRVTRNPEDMRHVVSYDLIMDGIRAIVAEGHVELAETLAEQVAAFVLKNPRVIRVFVRAEKLEIGPGGVGVEIERTRDVKSSAKLRFTQVHGGRKFS
ncbi:(5-formylfuran-3-yl)methyl phosphate synthase [Phyllobacterium myrsinacearum]|uniref:4-(hydroxymethyl)-2-furancarboxaldehyde-phosphate synthase n=1 Tax=Phyllobacterium myrsinacearum TaxID=28101 RepID=A0A839ETH3_9HYPH|nr:(5-formylfuran-3-yl)methyl phosphate synthase [Phyllobacterium myrsinacearum]MBA8881415.1 dihydroneopterin aldolase [Phyllobacterium myrsinacearum]